LSYYDSDLFYIRDLVFQSYQIAVITLSVGEIIYWRLRGWIYWRLWEY